MARFSDRVRATLEQAPRFLEFTFIIKPTSWILGFETLIMPARSIDPDIPEHIYALNILIHPFPCIILWFTYIYPDPCRLDVWYTFIYGTNDPT